METAWSNTTHTVNVAKDFKEAEDFRAIFDIESISEAVLNCPHGELIHVSTAMLVARSPYFKSLFAFNGSANVARDLASHKYKIDWTEHNAHVARELLCFLYTGQCSVHDEHVDKLLDLAAQVFVQSQRFESLLSALIHSMLKSKAKKALNCLETTTVLERLDERSDSLPAESTLVSSTVQALGGAALLWKRLFAVPLSVHIEVLTLAQPHISMDNLKLVEESTLLLLLHELTKKPAAKASRTGIELMFFDDVSTLRTPSMIRGSSSSNSAYSSSSARAGAASGAALAASISTTKLVFDLLTWC
jgi:BTB/POZ domain